MRIKTANVIIGIVLLVAATLVMPWLGHRKRHLAAGANSASLLADAAQSLVCAYLSWIALAGLKLNTVAHIPWADSRSGSSADSAEGGERSSRR
jgi:divalent metal cation (Fe/Co/Zn/Cd) transporter